MGAGARVLVVDDEPEIRLVLRAGLSARGFSVETVNSGRDGIEHVQQGHPDVVLLDLMLPDLRGTAIIEKIRTWSRVPIIMLSVEGAEGEKVRALELGADDYVTKPFGLDELVARIRAALRRVASSDRVSPVLRVGGLAIDFAQRRVTLDEQVIALSPTEYAIMKALAQNGGKVMSHRALLQEVWGPAYETEGHYLHVYIGRLRRKLEPGPTHPRYLITEPGTGYRLNFEADDEPMPRSPADTGSTVREPSVPVSPVEGG